MKKSFLFFFLSVLIIINGCGGASKVYKLTPVSDYTIWYHGKEFSNRQKNDIDIWVSFEGTEGKNYTFYLEIINNCDSTVLVDPEKFYCKKADNTVDITAVKKYNALDPEDRILFMERSIQSEQANYNISSGIDGAICLLGVIAEVGSISAPEEEREEIHNFMENHLNNMEEKNINHENKIADLNSEKERVETVFLRKTTLFTDERVSGLVQFPLVPDAKRLKFFFPVGDTTLSFLFNQHKF